MACGFVDYITLRAEKVHSIMLHSLLNFLFVERIRERAGIWFFLKLPVTCCKKIIERDENFFSDNKNLHFVCIIYNLKSLYRIYKFHKHYPLVKRGNIFSVWGSKLMYEIQ